MLEGSTLLAISSWRENGLDLEDKVLDGFLAFDGRIRWVGLLGGDLKTVKWKMRAGVESLTEKEEDDKVVGAIAPIVLGSLGQFTGKLGNLIAAGVIFDKVSLLFFKRGDKHLVVSAQPEACYEIMQKLKDKIPELLP